MPALRHPLLKAINLDTLLGFEAVARLGGVTAAADELCLTQSAVSKQLKALEDALGVRLLHRGGRGLSLTPAGQALQARLDDALARLHGALAQASAQGRRTLAITCPPGLASMWLTPRLTDWPDQADCPELMIDASEDQLTLAQAGMDLAIRLGPADAVDAPGERLMQEQLQLVCAPAVAAYIRSPQDLAAVAWLEFDHVVSASQGLSWASWADVVPVPAGTRLMRFSQYEHVVKAAIEGLGVAIGRRPLVDAALARGDLVVVCPHWARAGGVYRLLCEADAADRPQVQAFVAWLRRIAAAV